MMMAREHPRTDQPEHWQSLGACKTRPDLNWFPGQGEPQAEQIAICGECSVQAECLAYALTQSEVEDWGIWGGLSAKKRTAIRRRKAIASGIVRGPAECGTRSGYMRHRRRHETTCDACRAANAAYTAELARRNAKR